MKARSVRSSPVPECASQLARLVPKERLHPSVLAWAEEAPKRARWGVGFSGGADSLALLLLLWAHWPEQRRRLVALHLNHRLRGAESRADARFCRTVCRALGVMLVEETWQRPRAALPPSEATARAARLEFFRRHARVVWLGHQQDDVAETMLMRLARGSGTGGLAAPRPVQVFADGRVHLRPLLGLKKAEVAGALTAAGLAWREDATNAGEDFFRNRVRHGVMPAWVAAAQRDAVAGAARSRQLLEEDDTALEAWVSELEVLEPKGGLKVGSLDGKPRAVTRRALHRWIAAQRRKVDISSQAFEALLRAAEAGWPARHSLGTNLFGVIEDGILRLVLGRKAERNFRRRIN